MIEKAPQPQTPSDVQSGQSLTPIQRYKQVERLLVRHPRFNAVMARIDFCSLYANELPTINPPCIAILGETGAGKTTLVKTWIANARLKRYETPEGSIIPYLYVSVPAGATIKATASNILETLGDPNSGRGTQWNMVSRVYKLIKECCVRIIFVDEFQHIVEKETQRILYKVADFLTDIINHTGIPMILIGRIREAEPILRVNPPLDRRVGTPLILKPFEWNRAQAKTTIVEFCELMESIDHSRPFALSDLGTEEMAYRFYYATNGYLGHVMELIRYAAKGAIETECATLNLPLLEAAYDSRLAGIAIGRGKKNPFTADFSEDQDKLVIPAPQPTPFGQSGQKATTKRGQRQTTTKNLQTGKILRK